MSTKREEKRWSSCLVSHFIPLCAEEHSHRYESHVTHIQCKRNYVMHSEFLISLYWLGFCICFIEKNAYV